MDSNELENIFSSIKTKALNDWEELLKFKSNSFASEHKQDCRKCAEWLCQKMQEYGLKSNLLETSWNPVACGTFKGDPDKPHILFYGHYDVQPEDPIELWHSDPFQPEWRGDRLYARGAQDNKGQVMSFLQGVRTLIDSDQLKCSITILVEGEEEVGSHGLVKSLPEWKDWLKADVLVVMDTTMANADTPLLMLGIRGILGFEIEVDGLKKDLHSGLHGGIVRNPVNELIRLISTMFNLDGSVAVDGFYDGVQEPDENLLAKLNQLPFDEELYKNEVGLPPCGGELRFSPYVRNGLRPTMDVIGITAGYQGEGIKSVIPARALAKISCRMVASQNPDNVFSRIEEHINKNKLEGINVNVRKKEETLAMFEDVSDTKIVRDVQNIVKDIFGKEAVPYLCGASIPIIPDLVRASGAVPVLIGFGLEEDSIHSPNESYSLQQFKQGFMYSVGLLRKFSESPLS